MKYASVFIVMICLCFGSCGHHTDVKLFTLTNPEETYLKFTNDVPYDEEFNTYTYRNFYNGGGVAIGDINNDGLPDIYFTGNIENNKLFLNKGNWKFEDITEKAGVACPNVWSTGATMVDINGDGLLDIYVCKAGKPGGANRHNELFINQGDMTFVESAREYGLDIEGLSIHAAFFDYDRDGDLDVYILNNSLRSVGQFDLVEGQRHIPDVDGNKFLINNNGKFEEATQKVGMYSSKIGYGLGITISDFNNDNYPDVFISNDFFERDYLYINQQDGTFKEIGDVAMPSMSMGSMGADACDLNNDLLPDLFVTEMLPRTFDRKKTKTQFESWDKYVAGVDKGYHHQFARNVLHRNMGHEKFLEIGRFAGVADTDWSWASLAQDYDNDGLKDLFVSNGIFKDLLDRDYLNYSANATMIKNKIDKKEKVITMLIDSMPSMPIKNAVFKNEGHFKFTHVSDEWGFDIPTFSNGSAYADLDNDGDLDIIVNNVNMPSFIYKNNTDTSVNRSISIQLIGRGKNTKAIGAKVIATAKNKKFMVENYVSRGFQSSVDSKLHIGLGNINIVDSLEIFWPDGSYSLKTQLATNKTHFITQTKIQEYKNINPTQNLKMCIDSDWDFKHQDISINLFSREALLYEMQGFSGPAIAVADINNDQIDDIFIGGGKNQASKLYISTKDGKYMEVNTPFDMDYRSESISALFVDIDLDGDLDLYVAHGGKAFSSMSPELDDVIYINEGSNVFKKLNLAFDTPISTANFVAVDLNGDNLVDFVVAESMKTDRFGRPGSIYILTNLGNQQFKTEMVPHSKDIGMLTDIKVVDINGDGHLDILVCGKWMPLTYFLGKNGDFRLSKPVTIPQSIGLWNVLNVLDIDGDGDMDIIAGNEGENSFLKSGMSLYLNDFDDNGSVEPIICEKLNGSFYPIHDLDVLFSQIPMLKKRFQSYKAFSKVSIDQMFSADKIKNALKFTLDRTSSSIFINNKSGFEILNLPHEAQYSSVHSIFADRNQNHLKILLGGNFYKIKPQFGRHDGSMGWVLDMKGDFNQNNFKITPMYIVGQIRKILPYQDKFIFGINDESVKICSIN